jgi:hypothetical protein
VGIRFTHQTTTGCGLLFDLGEAEGNTIMATGFGLPRFSEADGVVARLDADGNLVMVVDPTTLPPDLFRKLFPSGTPGITPETVRVSIQRSSRFPTNQIELNQGQLESHTRGSEQPSKAASPSA